MTSLSVGVAYLLSLIPYFAVPSIIVYSSLRATGHILNFNIPTWALFISTTVARPLLTSFRHRYQYYQDAKAAERLGARLVPHNPEHALTVVKKALKSITDEFPGGLMHNWSLQHGHSFTIDRLSSRTIISSDPDLVKAMLATQFDSFEKGREFTGQMNSLLGNGIFNVDGEMWKFHRAMTRPFFTRERISDFETYDRNCETSMNLAKIRLRQGEPVEFQDLAARFTLDSATEFLCGHNVGSLGAGLPYPPSSPHQLAPELTSHPSNVFVRAFALGQHLAASRTALAEDWPIAELLGDKVVPWRRVMDDFTGPLMEVALRKWRNQEKEKYMSGKVNAGDEKDEDLNLLAYLVRHTQDPKILKDELVNLMVAGRDTTACLLTYSLYMISQHPAVEDRLREEIYEKAGTSGTPNYEHMREMKYMRAFLNEVLRLYPPVPNNVRRSNVPVLVPPKVPGEKPFYIPANTSILYSVINIHRRTDLWGPDALEFDPMRFIDSRVNKYITPNPYIFCPFNAGPRICLGQQFAYHEATFFLVRLLQRFKKFKLDDRYNVSPPDHWKTSNEGTKKKEKIHSLSDLTMYVKGGLWVQMEEI
ncbi:cytochrome P450 monooxygenase pc-3 [Crepidotus variabilis]|uniref:Cytochrome P450 monooxygenase pc-3 n=1 Tax=Crepidotus variabilis TaxID=179855 RepID=A0A9P6EKW3_9AGAR|nr:cytochrome P450 monooxygenase pc-3 [Crepidotus variabilis]